VVRSFDSSVRGKLAHISNFENILTKRQSQHPTSEHQPRYSQSCLHRADSLSAPRRPSRMPPYHVSAAEHSPHYHRGQQRNVYENHKSRLDSASSGHSHNPHHAANSRQLTRFVHETVVGYISPTSVLQHDNNRFQPFNLTAAILFVASGGGLWAYFTYEKERMARKRIADQTKGIGKPKVGGPFQLMDHEGNKFTSDDMLGKYSLVRPLLGLNYPNNHWSLT
jgi:hypothetical protein